MNKEFMNKNKAASYGAAFGCYAVDSKKRERLIKS